MMKSYCGRSLAGAGLGLLWTKSNDFSLRLAYAWEIGLGKVLSANAKNGCFGRQSVKYF